MQSEKNQKDRSHNNDEWLTVAEVADRLKCHEQTVRKMILSRKLPAVQVGRTYRIRMVDLPEALAVR